MSENVADYLQRMGAHHDVVTWAAEYDGDFEAAYQACPRGDWLLAVAVRVGVSPRERMCAAAACARVGLGWLDDAVEAESALCRLESAARGESDVARLAALATEFESGQPPDPASASALSAVVLALSSAQDPDAAAMVPAAVVQAAMFAVADCAVMSLLRHTQQETADAVRLQIPYSSVRAAACGATR